MGTPTTTPAEEADTGPEPISSNAVTAKVYLVPLVSPLTVQVVGPSLHQQDAPPGVATTK